MIVSGHFDDNSVPELLNELHVDLRGCVVPHLERIITSTAVDVGREDELAITLLAKLLNQPFHLRLADTLMLEVFRPYAVVVESVHREIRDLVCQVDTIVATFHKSPLDAIQVRLAQVLHITG